MRLLIVKLSSFGDVIHTFPAITDLKAARPDIEVDWLVEESLAPFVALHPGVAAIHTLAFRRLRKPPSRWPRLAGETWRLRNELRARNYDLVVDLQGLMKSALPARLAGPVSGYDAASAREPAAARLYRHPFSVPKQMHAVERTRHLLAAAIGYPAPEGKGRYGIAASGPPDPTLGLPARYAMVMHAASWPTKLWPEEHWQALLPRLAAGGRGIVLPWGSAGEKARAERLASGIPGAVVLPRVMAGADLASVIAGAELAVGLDLGADAPRRCSWRSRRVALRPDRPRPHRPLWRRPDRDPVDVAQGALPAPHLYGYARRRLLHAGDRGRGRGRGGASGGGHIGRGAQAMDPPEPQVRDPAEWMESSHLPSHKTT